MAFGSVAQAQAEVLWRGDFETGDLSQWNYLLNPTLGERENITVVTSPVKEGSRAGRVEIHPDDLWSNGHNRVELKYDGKRTREGETTYFSWYFRLEANAQTHNDIAYWETNNSYSQSMAFYVDPANGGTSLGFRFNGGAGELWSGPITAGEWHQIAMQIVWSEDPAVGKVSVWVDGAKVVSDAPGRTKPDVNSLFIQMGYHRNSTAPATEVIYLDGALEATTLDEVLGGPRGSGDSDDGGGCRFAPNGASSAWVPTLAALAALMRRRLRKHGKRAE